MYYELTINAAEPETEIWLIDENGHPVQKGIGTLSTHVLGGTYFIAFGLKARRCCSISLDTSVLTSQAELEHWERALGQPSDFRVTRVTRYYFT